MRSQFKSPTKAFNKRLHTYIQKTQQLTVNHGNVIEFRIPVNVGARETAVSAAIVNTNDIDYNVHTVGRSGLCEMWT